MHQIRLFIFILLGLYSVIGFASPITYSKTENGSIINKEDADSMYAKGDFESAASLYTLIIEKQGVAPEIYYNLGNCYYRTGNMPLAILNYERALKLDPSDSDIRNNLSLARSKIQDKSSEPSEFFFLAWWYSLSNRFTLSFWKTIALILFLFSLILCILYLTLQKEKGKKLFKHLSITSFILCMICNAAAWQQYHSSIDINAAIVTSEKVEVKSSPSTSSTDLFVIHAGTRLKILDNSMKEWSEVEYEEGKEGWVKNDDIAVI